MERASVIIPTYNRAHVIARSINSILQQTYQEFEIIVIDDGGNDDTEEILKKIGDTRISYYRTETNHGAAGARNEGVRLAKYDIIAFQDSDDEWHSQKLEKQMKYLAKHPEYNMVYTGFRTHHLDKQITHMPHPDMPGEFEGDIFRDLLLLNKIGTPTIVLKKIPFFQSADLTEN